MCLVITSLENLLWSNSSLLPLPPFPWFLLVLDLYVFSRSPVISFGNQPEFANDKVIPHTQSMRWITELRMKWSSCEPLCLLEFHSRRWTHEWNSVKWPSSSPKGKSAHAWFQKALFLFPSSWPPFLPDTLTGL